MMNASTPPTAATSTSPDSAATPATRASGVDPLCELAAAGSTAEPPSANSAYRSATVSSEAAGREFVGPAGTVEEPPVDAPGAGCPPDPCAWFEVAIVG